jgi:hypothetical protein
MPHSGVLSAAPWRSLGGMIARASVLGGLFIVLAGCDKSDYDEGYGCRNFDLGNIGLNGTPDPCGDHQTAANRGCAAGEYVHWKLPWEAPTLLWIGAADEAPECPLGPTTISYEGHADLYAPNLCEACTCELPTGSCTLPSKFTANTMPCSNIPGGINTSFDAPVLWDGHCDDMNPLPTNAASSLTIGALTIAENGCASGPPAAAKVVSLHWNTMARGCDVSLPQGPVERSRCLTDDPPPPGFRLCIFQPGEHVCPDDEPGNVFTEQHVFYQGVEDDRTCSPCTCGPPEGSMCKAKISIYENAACTDPALNQITISSVSSTCTDIQSPGQALGSKSAASTIYLPGKCAPMGGEESGAAIKLEPDTLCCRL